MNIFLKSLFTFILGLTLVITPARADNISGSAICFHTSNLSVNGLHLAGIQSPFLGYGFHSTSGKLFRLTQEIDSTNFVGNPGSEFFISSITVSTYSPCKRYRATTITTFGGVSVPDDIKFTATPQTKAPGGPCQ
jgi:hypothetical protein